MKKILTILICLFTLTLSANAEKGWVKATKTDFPIDPQDIENPKYTIGWMKNNICLYFFSVLGVPMEWNGTSSSSYYFTGTNCRIILIPVRYVEERIWENKDDTEYYISLYLEDPVTEGKYLYYAKYENDNKALMFRKDYSDALKFKLNWDENGNATFVCGDKMIMGTYFYNHNILRNDSRIDLVRSDDTTYNYSPAYLFMEKEIIEWNPGFRKEIALEDVMEGPAKLAERDGYFSEINNTFSVMASENPTKIYLSGTTTDATTMKWMMEQESLSIEPKADYPELDYSVSKFDYPFYDTFSITPSPELVGKSYKFTLSRGLYDPDFSLTEAMVPGSTDFTVKIIPNAVKWNCNGNVIENDRITVNYDASSTSGLNFNAQYTGAAQASSTKPQRAALKYDDPYGDPWAGSSIEGFAKNEDGSYTMVNDPVWNFTSEDEEKTVTLTTDAKPEGLPKNVFGSAPDLTLTVKPHKPVLEVTETKVAHKKGDYDEVYRITIPKGVFEPGSDSEHYARIMLVPQFPTFDNAEAAAQHYGTAPRNDVADSWLSPQWYQVNGHEGYLPIMVWDDFNEQYYCEINPNEMIYESWDGNHSFGHKLVSGHYKAYLIASENPDHRQYGIVPSDPVDLYIHPTLHDMTMALNVRDSKGQDPYWKTFTIENDWFTFNGPLGNDNGETAYRHARLIPNSDFCEIWVESSRHRPAYPEGEIPGQKPVEKAARKAALRDAASDELNGYTKVESDDYVDLSQPEDDQQEGTDMKFTSASIKLVKNGTVSPELSFYVSKAGDGIVTGIDGVAATAHSETTEYFTTSGVKVAFPNSPGIYLQRRGTTTRKITIR